MGVQGGQRLNALVHFLTIFQQSAIGRSDFTGTVRAGSFSANDQCIFNLNFFFSRWESQQVVSRSCKTVLAQLRMRFRTSAIAFLLTGLVKTSSIPALRYSAISSSAQLADHAIIFGASLPNLFLMIRVVSSPSI